MRKKFVFIVFVPLVALATVAYLYVDEWVESGLESAGEAVVGAKVEIDNLSVTLSPLAIQLDRLQVTNPKDTWKNIFETGHVRAALDFGQLLRGKYIVETVEVNELILGTQRTTDGALPKKPERESTTPSFIKEATDKIAGKVAQAPMFDLQKLRAELKIDSLLDVQALKSVQHIDTLKRRVQEAEQEWRSVVADFDRSKLRLAEIEATVKAIRIDELKTVDAMLKAVDDVNGVYRNVNELNETFKNRRTSVDGQIKRITASVDTIDDLAKQDYERLKTLARLPDMSMAGLANLLLGKAVLLEVDYYLGWIDYARATVPKYIPKQEYERPKRFKGQDIHFPTERSYPKLWIKKVLISGGEDRRQRPEYFYARGEVRNITDNQRQAGEPLTIALLAKKGERTSLTFDALFDRRKENPHDRYKAKVTGISLGDFTIGRSDFLPSRITRSTAVVDVNIDVPGGQFDSRLLLQFADLTLEYDRSPKNDVERIVREVLQAVNRFDVSLRLWNTAGKVELAFATDLDDQIAARTRQVIGAELARLQNEIRAKVNQRIAEKRQEFERLFNQKKEEVLGQIRTYENLINEKIAFVESKRKELEARIEEEKKKQSDAARKKLEDAVRGLIRKQ